MWENVNDYVVMVFDWLKLWCVFFKISYCMKWRIIKMLFLCYFGYWLKMLYFFWFFLVLDVEEYVEILLDIVSWLVNIVCKCFFVFML